MTCALPYESYYVCQSIGEACERCRINPIFTLAGVICLTALILAIIIIPMQIKRMEKEDGDKRTDKT